MDHGDLEREQDIEELRKIALAQHAQLKLMMEPVEQQRRVIGKAQSKRDHQLTLQMIEELKAKVKQTEQAFAKADAQSKERKARSSSGPTAQPNLPIVERVFTLDAPDRSARAAAASCDR